MPSFATPAPGTVFGGDFVVLRPLKEGGMGAVYVAEQRSTGAMRALKLMHPQHAGNEAMRRRFEQEARVGARIDSDHVVEVIAAGVDEASGAPWIAMELLDGEDLGEYATRLGTLSPRETLDVFRMLCHALGAAHDAGIVHRDLKPENVFLARSRRTAQGEAAGPSFTLKVLDFGIARMNTDALATATAALGTPLWMAPEQTATGPKITPATDVWALGLIAFTLLAGSWYWRTAHEESPTVTQFLRELTLEPLDAASARATDLGLQALPAGFDAWFARCVVRDPAGRFADARAALEALEPVLARAADADAVTKGGTVPVEASAFAPRGLKPVRPFFVGTETERALARGVAAPAPAPAPALTPTPTPAPALTPAPSTGPATSITRDTGPRRRASRWLLLAAAVALVALLVAAQVLHGALFPRTDATPAPTACSAPPPPAPASASGDAAKLAALEVAKDSPTLAFPGTVYPVGYALGAVDERPVHDVSFPTFFLQIDETTVAQYARCVAVGRCTPAGTEEFCNAGRPGRERNPVNCVSNVQAAAYCAWLGRRLPTEDEWEYAASGKAKRLYAWGNQAPGVGRVCWGRPDAGTCDVASFDAGATPEGLHDITGDVWEWTSSDYCPYDGSACTHDQKVARGGGWFSTDHAVVRTQVRQGYAPLAESANVGFRCARSL